MGHQGQAGSQESERLACLGPMIFALPFSAQTSSPIILGTGEDNF